MKKLNITYTGAAFLSAVLFFLAGVVNAQTCVQPPPGLVSWWPAEGNANDIVDGNDGVLQNGAAFAPGKVGQGFSLDGTDDFVLVSPSDDLNITGDVTVDLWAQRTTFVGTPMMVTKGAGATAGDPPTVYALRFVNAVLGCSTCNNSLNTVFERANGSNVNLFGPTVTDTNFHHYAYVREGSAHKLFVDGVEVDVFA